MTDKQIALLFQSRMSEEVIRISDCSHGAEQTVKIVETATGKYILKIPLPRNEMMIFRETFACERLKRRDFVPRMILAEKGYLIESCVEGKMMSRARLLTQQRRSVYMSLGKSVRSIHGIKMRGFGEMQEDFAGRHPTLAEHIGSLLRKNATLLLKTEFLSDKEISDIRAYLKEGADVARRQSSVLLHFDLTDANIMVSKGDFSGLIDFGDLSCGPRAYDIAKFYIEKYGTSDYGYFLEGYGGINQVDVEYFAVCHLLYEIPYYHSIGDKDRCVKLLQILDDIIRR